MEDEYYKKLKKMYDEKDKVIEAEVLETESSTPNDEGLSTPESYEIKNNDSEITDDEVRKEAVKGFYQKVLNQQFQQAAANDPNNPNFSTEAWLANAQVFIKRKFTSIGIFLFLFGLFNIYSTLTPLIGGVSQEYIDGMLERLKWEATNENINNIKMVYYVTLSLRLAAALAFIFTTWILKDVSMKSLKIANYVVIIGCVLSLPTFGWFDIVLFIILWWNVFSTMKIWKKVELQHKEIIKNTN